MKEFLGFIKATALGGLFVMLPLVVFILVVMEAVDLLTIVIDPVIELLPVDEWGDEIAAAAAVFILVAFCFIVGYLIGTGFGAALSAWMNRTVLDRIPGFAFIRTVTGRRSGRIEGTLLAPALISLPGDRKALALSVEELDDGDYAVFMPSAPTPTVGSVCQVSRDRLTRIDASAGQVADCLMRWGMGSKEIFSAGTLSAEAEAEPR